MAYLADTNVLLRLVMQADPLHEQTLVAVEVLKAPGETLFATSQNFVELWNVATRPATKNGLRQSPEAAQQILSTFEAGFPRLPDSDRVYETWRELVIRFAVSGVQVHDTRLVATMLVHEVSNILTYNAADFTRFAELGISVANPEALGSR